MTFAKRIFIFLAVMAGIIVFIVMMIVGQEERKAEVATWDKLKPNDSIFLKDIYLSDSSFKAFPTFRKIRPLNEDDVNKMNISSWKKLKMIAQLDTTSEHARPVMIEGKLTVTQDDMFKQKTAFIGTYVRSDSVSGIYKETIYIPLKWHIIKPNYNLCDTISYKSDPLPANYTYADSDIYVDIKSVILTEPNIFKKLKKQ